MDDSRELVRQVGLSEMTAKSKAQMDDARRSRAEKAAAKDLKGYSDPIASGLDEYTRMSEAIDSDSDKSFHVKGAPRADTGDATAQREKDALLVHVGVTKPPPAVDDLGLPTSYASHPKHHTPKLYNLRDDDLTANARTVYHAWHKHSEPDFVAQAESFLKDPRRGVRRLEHKIGAEDRRRAVEERRRERAAARNAHARHAARSSPGGQGPGSPSQLLHAAADAQMPAEYRQASNRPPAAPSAAVAAAPAAALPAAAAAPKPPAISVTEVGSAAAVPLAVEKQPDDSLLVYAESEPVKAVEVTPAGKDLVERVKREQIHRGEEAARRREEAEGRAREERRRERRARRLSQEFLERQEEERARERRRQQRLADEAVQDKEAVEITRLKAQVRHMRERERIRKLQGSVTVLRRELAASDAAKAVGAPGAGAGAGKKGPQGPSTWFQKMTAKTGKAAPPTSGAAKGGEGQPDQRIRVCDALGCETKVLPKAGSVAERPARLSGASTRGEIREALDGSGKSVASLLLPWDGAWKSEVHLNDKGEIRADHDDPHSHLMPHQKYQNAVYNPSAEDPVGEDHARGGGEEAPGVTNRVGKHLFQDSIVQAQEGFNDGLGRHTRAQQAADWERNWEGVRTRNSKGQDIVVG